MEEQLNFLKTEIYTLQNEISTIRFISREACYDAYQVDAMQLDIQHKQGKIESLLKSLGIISERKAEIQLIERLIGCQEHHVKYYTENDVYTPEGFEVDFGGMNEDIEVLKSIKAILLRQVSTHD